MRKVIITGISGYIAHHLTQRLPEDIVLIGTIRSVDKWRHSPHLKLYPVIPLFLEQEVAPQLESMRPDLVIHTAAMASLSACEQKPELAQRINAAAAEELAVWCNSVGARLVHLSTDIVFKGDMPPYDEASATEPVNAYGRSKLDGERAVRRISQDHAVVRIALAMGRGLGPIKNFADWFMERLRTGQEIPLFQDEIRTPTFVQALADMLWKIAFSREQGVFHLCGDQALNRFELGRMFCDYLGYGHKQLKGIWLEDMKDCRRPVDVSEISTRQVAGSAVRIKGIGEFIREVLGENK